MAQGVIEDIAQGSHQRLFVAQDKEFSGRDELDGVVQRLAERGVDGPLEQFVEVNGVARSASGEFLVAREGEQVDYQVFHPLQFAFDSIEGLFDFR